MLKINQIYHSIQGESTYAGRPCVFVRLTGCNLRCTYCDTEHAFYDGKKMSVQEVIDQIKSYDSKLVEITGGEPLLQEECIELMKNLCNEGFEVLIETAGNMPIKNIDERVKVIMDLKCPSSEMMDKNLYENVNHLKKDDEVKFVIGTKEDYNWSKETIQNYKLSDTCIVLFSCVFDKLEPLKLVNWILEDKLDVRFQLQMHKYIWHPEIKGV
ncbi:MAG: radical SAM protein [Ignavibacteria bacterium]|nr:radical SAM protein [Ignavibacteria bacterium]MBT8383354.1 radical SAM protein [Ignavibacteria bacterium]MBT8390380.1 radical SAM protein [Ignavibacteria bacterium]NNJ53360.1 radical SAM protein [Ignavibacteriaceae bacterium]NNL21625.1 radical SAM protein [Ignavibacteriaceae bacterium]